MKTAIFSWLQLLPVCSMHIHALNGTFVLIITLIFLKIWDKVLRAGTCVRLRVYSAHELGDSAAILDYLYPGWVFKGNLQ